jgi:hypothetical protein
MKQLAAELAARINLAAGTEPLIILQIDWPSGPVNYGDRDVTLGVTQVVGAIASLGGLAEALQSTNAGSIGAVSVTLNDTDGSLQTRMKDTAIEGLAATLFLAYADSEDLSSLLTGRITSDIGYQERTRQLTFNLETLKSREVGYAPAAGDVTGLLRDAEGKPWPLVFGSVIKLPCQKVTGTVNGKTQTFMAEDLSTTSFVIDTNDSLPTGTIDARLRVKTWAIFDIRSEDQAYYFPFISSPAAERWVWLLMSGSFTDNTFNISTNNKDYYTSLTIQSRGDALNDPAVLWVAAGVNLAGKFCYISSIGRINFCIGQQGTKCVFATPWLDSANDPVALGSGTINNVAGVPKAAWGAYKYPNYYSYTSPVFGGTTSSLSYHTFNTDLIAAASDEFRILGTDRYVINLAPTTTVHQVFAKRTVDSKTELVAVPSSYYTKYLNNTLGIRSNCAYLEFTVSLDEREEGWADSEIYVTQTSSLTANSVSAIEYLIDTYTDYSFASSTYITALKTHYNLFPIGCAIRDVRDVLELVSDIAYQSRLAVQFSGSTFGVKCLSESPDQYVTRAGYATRGAAGIVDLTVAQIDGPSFAMSFRPIEDVATKLKVTWQRDLSVDALTYEYFNNEDTFGLQESAENYWIYNIEGLVKLSADFNGYRKSNAWRRIKATSYLPLAAYQPFDPMSVTVDTLSANTLDGQVINLDHDTLEHKITVDVELASKTGVVTLGEPVIDTNYWSGDPANPVTGWTTAPASVVTGLAEMDYTIQPSKPTDTVVEPPKDYKLSVNWPDVMKRATNYTVTVSAQSFDGQILRINGTYTLYSNRSDGSDTINKSSITFVNGIATLTNLQITGGSGDDSLSLYITGSPTIGPSEAVGVSDAAIVWTTPNVVSRDEVFTASLTGGAPSTAYSISISSTDSAERLYQGASQLTSITTDGSGNWTASDLKFTLGTDQLASATITATQGGKTFTSDDVSILGIESGVAYQHQPDVGSGEYYTIESPVTPTNYSHRFRLINYNTSNYTNTLQIFDKSAGTWVSLIGYDKSTNKITISGDSSISGSGTLTTFTLDASLFNHVGSTDTVTVEYSASRIYSTVTYIANTNVRSYLLQYNYSLTFSSYDTNNYNVNNFSIGSSGLAYYKKNSTNNTTAGLVITDSSIDVYHKNSSGVTQCDINLSDSGLKLNTATSYKLGFFGVTPVVQYATSSSAITDTADATYSSNEQTMLNNLKAQVNLLRSALVGYGLVI